jgi:hypothetical protein
VLVLRQVTIRAQGAVAVAWHTLTDDVRVEVARFGKLKQGLNGRAAERGQLSVQVIAWWQLRLKGLSALGQSTVSIK